MRELHVVAVSEDGRHVLLAGTRGSTKGGFRVALDDRLTAAVRGDLRQPGSDAPLTSDLSPKEIQHRLRSGESAESIAQAAGVPVARVERFSGPVQGEMARIIDATRASYVVRGRLGRSAVPLGAAVDFAISQAPSLRPDSTEWETRRADDGTWLVTVTWFARKRVREASWRYDPSTKALTSIDPASAALAHRDTALPVPPRRGAAAAAPAPVKRAPAKKVVAKKAPAKQAAVKKAPAKKAVAAKKAVPAKTPAKKAAPARKAPAPRAIAAPARQRALRVVPDTPVRKTKTAAERDGVKTRATVPGWADVLLGTSPGSDR